MRITALQTQTKHPNRLNVFIDDHFALGVNVLIIQKLDVQVGQEISLAQLEQLQHEEALQQAVDRALNYLSFRPRSRAEVRRYLRRKETPVELVETVLERLDALELVDDQAFATFWIEAREQANPKGAQALKSELRMKGVTREVVDALVDDEQDGERALRAGRKKALSLMRQPEIDYAIFSARLGSFLQRRGFSYEVASRTVRMLWQELKEEPPEEEV